jgi:predicted transcriptional regulator of viral defense system/very-short-patch-repair endonuclease
MGDETAFTRLRDGFVQTRHLEARIAELAGRQHGVVGRGQLVELGMGEDAIDCRRRRGSLHRIHPGVYAVGHRVLSREGWWMAAVLASGPGAALSHRSAAALWGLRSDVERIELTVPRDTRSTRDICRHRSSLPGDEVTECDGVPVTTVPRTLFDLAAAGPPESVESALRESEFLRLYDRLSLPLLLERYPGRRGSATVRACLARRRESPGRIRSPLEQRFLPFLDRHRLPRPQFNVVLEAGPKTYRVDCLWPASMQIVELDGWEGHGTRVAFREDRERDRRLRVAGYGVTRIAWSQLEDEPAALAADLRDLLNKRT